VGGGGGKSAAPVYCGKVKGPEKREEAGGVKQKWAIRHILLTTDKVKDKEKTRDRTETYVKKKTQQQWQWKGQGDTHGHIARGRLSNRDLRLVPIGEGGGGGGGGVAGSLRWAGTELNVLWEKRN